MRPDRDQENKVDCGLDPDQERSQDPASDGFDPSSPSILRQIRDGLVVLDLQGRILFTNPIFLEMVGRSGEDLRGRPGAEIFDAVTWPLLAPGRLPPMDDAGESHFNLCVPDRSGRKRSYCFIASPVRDDDGRVIGVLENFRGMDRLRDLILQLEEVTQLSRREKEKTDRILNSIADGVFAVDQERRIVSFSDKMARLTGIDPANAAGRTCMEVLRGTKCDTDCPLRWSFGNGRVVENCSETLRVPARDIPAFITTAFLHDTRGAVTGLTGVVHDRSEVDRLRRDLQEVRAQHDIIARGRAMQEIIKVVETVADTDATVLITGESGTGKEIVAKALHRLSGRRDKPFVTLNCASLNDNLLESELFGHVRGAFTGAVKDKPGRFELAAGGTIFLDEIGDTTPALQVKLLRVLQEKSFERVGETRTRSVDVRIIAATNRDLRSLVQGGRFREDLFYRLSVVPIHLPPLRDRREDIPLLVQHFIDKYRPRYFGGREQEFEGISNRALALLLGYDWPGNVRELEHTIEYAMISTTSNRIERAFLPAPLRQLQPAGGEAPVAAARPGAAGAGAAAAGAVRAGAADGVGAVDATRSVDVTGMRDEDALIHALQRNRWNATRTARDLGISRTTLWRRMKSLDLLKHSSDRVL